MATVSYIHSPLQEGWQSSFLGLLPGISPSAKYALPSRALPSHGPNRTRHPAAGIHISCGRVLSNRQVSRCLFAQACCRSGPGPWCEACLAAPSGCIASSYYYIEYYPSSFLPVPLPLGICALILRVIDYFSCHFLLPCSLPFCRSGLPRRCLSVTLRLGIMFPASRRTGLAPQTYGYACDLPCVSSGPRQISKFPLPARLSAVDPGGC